MSSLNEQLVELERRPVVIMGANSPYILLPQVLRREIDIEPGDEIAFLRAPGQTDITIRVIKSGTASGRPAGSQSSVGK